MEEPFPILLLRLLLFQQRLDLVFDLVGGLHVSILAVVDADNVKPVAALHQITDLSFGLGERCFLKLWNRAALADPTQRTAFFGAARIFRIFLREIFKLRASLQLLKQIFGAMLRIGHAFLVYFAAGPGQRSLNQDVAYLGLLIDAVLVPVLVVISLEIAVRDLDSALNLAEIYGCILDLPFFRDGIVVLRLVTLVERLQFSIRRM